MQRRDVLWTTSSVLGPFLSSISRAPMERDVPLQASLLTSLDKMLSNINFSVLGAFTGMLCSLVYSVV